MEQNIDDINKNFKLRDFYNSNKNKLYSLILIILIMIPAIFFFQLNQKNNNKLIADKFIEANIYLSTDQKPLAISLYSEIILEKNKFYSNLALAKILENTLINDKELIIKYFKAVEESGLTKDQKDNLIFKKSLYLIKNDNKKEGISLLKNLIEENSSLKLLAKDVLEK